MCMLIPNNEKIERKKRNCKCGKIKETPDTLMCWNCWRKYKYDK